MTLAERIRRWVGSDDGPVPDTPQQPIPKTQPPQSSTGQRLGSETDVPSSPAREPADPTELPIAQGQELLGPCRTCDGYWTREIVRGQKPLTCPVCKREGAPER